MRFIPSSASDRRQLLDEIGLGSVDDLFAGIPASVRLGRPLRLPPPMSEAELLDYFASQASRNRLPRVSFLGAGVYHHHIPAVVDALASRSEFYTAYTPYQAEVAQGTLQALFEFQTYMTQMTGMDIANASLYDGGTALAEAVLMAHRINPRSRFLVAASVHPEYRSIIDTYVRRFDIEVETVDFNDEGRIDTRRLQALLGPDVSGVAIQSPNFFGTIEDTAQVSRMAHEAGALSLVAVAEVMSLGLLRPPGAGETEARADVVCGEAQSLGIPMSFGGPHLGFIAARQEYVRQLPGRLVGMGQDEAGRRAFVVTLATREQHIRRERATSNICTNQSLCAVMATIYLAAVGPHLLREIAGVNTLNLKYLMDRIARDTPHSVRFAGPRFNEVVVSIDGDFHGRVDRLRRDGIVAGLSLERYFPDLADSLLITVTEVHGKADIDALVEGLA